MSRSQAVREECLNLDGYRCAICGYDGRDEQFRPWVAPHHGVAGGGSKLGMGGSTEQDTVENTITLCSGLGDGGLPPNRRDFLGPNEGSCHTMVESGKWIIVRWERPYGEKLTMNGVLQFDRRVHGELEVFDIERRKIPHELLWFYRRKDAEEGEEILSQLSSFALLDSTIAERVYRLGQVVAATDPDSRSLRECLASKGLDTRRLMRAARLWEQSIENGFEWLAGVTVSDYARMVREAGLVKRREFYHVKLPKGWLLGARSPVWYRTAYAEELRDTMNPGDVLLGINKFEYGYRAEGGDLFDPEGKRVDVIHFKPENLTERDGIPRVRVGQS